MPAVVEPPDRKNLELTPSHSDSVIWMREENYPYSTETCARTTQILGEIKVEKLKDLYGRPTYLKQASETKDFEHYFCYSGSKF